MSGEVHPVAPLEQAATPAPTHIRYRVLALTVTAYIDHVYGPRGHLQCGPPIQKEFGFSLITMGWILSAFQWGYASFQIPSAWFGDRIGPRRALTTIVILWSLFTSAVTLAWSATSMAAIQFLFGTCESGAFPIATCSLSRWMLPAERGMAQGLTHAGSRLGGRAYSNACGSYHRPLGMASGFCLLCIVGHPLGLRLVLVLSQTLPPSINL